MQSDVEKDRLLLASTGLAPTVCFSKPFNKVLAAPVLLFRLQLCFRCRKGVLAAAALANFYHVNHRLPVSPISTL